MQHLDESCGLYNGTAATPQVSISAAINCTYTSMSALLTICLNSLLIISIVKSPKLRTHPNAFLISICANGLVLSVCMLLDTLTTCLSHLHSHQITWLMSLQNCGLYCCLMNYWLAFMSIGYYRNTVIDNPIMAEQLRSRLITKLLCLCWLLSGSLTVMFGVIHVLLLTGSEGWCVINSHHQLVLFNMYEVAQHSQTRIVSHYILLVFVITLMVLAVAGGIIIMTYCTILQCPKNFICTAKRNKVFPVNPAETSSDHEILGVTNIPVPMWFIMKSAANNIHNMHPYVTQQSSSRTTTAVPSQLFTTQSSRSPLRGSDCDEFTALSITSDNNLTPPGAETVNMDHRLSASIPYQSTKLSNAAKNIVVMMAIFVTCSTLLFLCGIPNLFSAMHCHKRSILVTISKSIFYINGYSYPVWYLFCTRKVRNVICRAVYHHQWT